MKVKYRCLSGEIIELTIPKAQTVWRTLNYKGYDIYCWYCTPDKIHEVDYCIQHGLGWLAFTASLFAEKRQSPDEMLAIVKLFNRVTGEEILAERPICQSFDA